MPNERVCGITIMTPTCIGYLAAPLGIVDPAVSNRRLGPNAHAGMSGANQSMSINMCADNVLIYGIPSRAESRMNYMILMSNNGDEHQRQTQKRAVTHADGSNAENVNQMQHVYV